MIDQTIPLPELTAGMARCLREWILPHLEDPMARTQAETLAVLLEALPGALSGAVHRAILEDSEAARQMLRRAGEDAAEPSAPDIDSALRENSALKARLLAIAESLRGDSSEQGRRRLVELQRFFVESMQRELGMAKHATDFATMSAREGKARKG